jgi:hypothetical protein
MMLRGKALFTNLLVGLLILYVAGLLIYMLVHMEQFQWDFRTYYFAAEAYTKGLNPYDVNTISALSSVPITLKFVYPPVTLLFFRLFVLVDYDAASYLFLAFKFMFLMALVALWKYRILKDRADLPFYFFCVFAFNSAIYIDISAGNISVIEQFFIWLAFLFFLKRKIPLFCLLIIIAGFFKVWPILFLFLLWFSNEKKKWKYFSGSLLTFIALMLISFMISPGLFANFMQNAGAIYERGVRNPATFSLIMDPFQLLAKETGIIVPVAVPMIIFSIVIIGILFTSWQAYRRLSYTEREDKEKLFLFLACLVYALILPRFKDYSYILLIVPAYFILKELTYRKATPVLFILIILPSPISASLPGISLISRVIWEYYSLFMAFGIWGLYIYEIFSHGNGKDRKLRWNVLTGE